MDAITRVFTNVGQVENISSALAKLMAYFLSIDPYDQYAAKKAAGSLGGASRWGYIKLINKCQWMRMR